MRCTHNKYITIEPLKLFAALVIHVYNVHVRIGIKQHRRRVETRRRGSEEIKAVLFMTMYHIVRLQIVC